VNVRVLVAARARSSAALSQWLAGHLKESFGALVWMTERKGVAKRRKRLNYLYGVKDAQGTFPRRDMVICVE